MEVRVAQGQILCRRSSQLRWLGTRAANDNQSACPRFFAWSASVHLPSDQGDRARVAPAAIESWRRRHPVVPLEAAARRRARRSARARRWPSGPPTPCSGTTSQIAAYECPVYELGEQAGPLALAWLAAPGGVNRCRSSGAGAPRTHCDDASNAITVPLRRGCAQAAATTSSSGCQTIPLGHYPGKNGRFDILPCLKVGDPHCPRPVKDARVEVRVSLVPHPGSLPRAVTACPARMFPAAFHTSALQRIRQAVHANRAWLSR